MSAALVAGLAAGYGVAIPVGAIAPLLMNISARSGLRVGAAAAVGVASADGLYAAAAVLGGAALAERIAPAAGPLRWAAAAALALLAGRLAFVAWRDHHAASGRPGDADGGRGGGGVAPGDRGSRRRVALLADPRRAYAALLGLTLMNPATIVYFTALVVGDRATGGRSGAAGAVFVAAVFAASASWQLALAGGGAAVGRRLTGPRGRLVTAVASAVVIAALAAHLALAG